jgi:hypothetical protein
MFPSMMTRMLLLRQQWHLVSKEDFKGLLFPPDFAMGGKF